VAKGKEGLRGAKRDKVKRGKERQRQKRGKVRVSECD